MSERGDGEEVVFEISNDALATSELTGEQLGVDLNYLADALGDALCHITGEKIGGTNQIRLIHYLADSLRFFDDNESQTDLIERFKSPQEAISHLPMVFFARYVLVGLGELTFEPELGDLELLWNDQTIVFEFKYPRESKVVQKHREHHLERLDEIKEALDTRYQYDIRNNVSDDLDLMVPLLEAAIPEISGPGRTMVTNTIEVIAQSESGFNENPVISGLTIPGGAMQDTDSGHWRPLTIHGGEDASFSIAGPKIDESDKLEHLITRARKQLDKEKPVVVAIDTESMMGSISDLKRRAQKLFSGSKNTRINAILLYDQRFAIEGGVLFNSRVIRNPFSEIKLPNEFFDELSDIDEEVFFPENVKS